MFLGYDTVQSGTRLRGIVTIKPTTSTHLRECPKSRIRIVRTLK
jgi:hypothetical protein